MDIAATQTDASTRATAWLTQNLPVATELAAPPAETPPPGAVVVAPAALVEPPAVKPGLTEAIRRDRETRSAATAAQSEATKAKTELETLRKETEALRALGSANDPFEFLRGRKLTKEQQALWGQAFLYDLKPEVAPQEFRLELYKAEQARKEAERSAETERLAGEQARRQESEQLQRYANDLVQHVQTSLGSCPESEIWFTEEGPDGAPTVNHQVYAKSLLATADNLARSAQAAGQVADLSPANIAKVLEAEVSKRMQRRDAKRASVAPVAKQAPVAPAASGVPAAVTTTTTSAQGLRSGPPVAPAQTPEERAARAASVLFGTK